MTLKTGLGVVQGHWKCRRSIDHIRLSIGPPFYWYRFWVIWRWVMTWPWNLGLRSLNIIQTGTLWCDFLFAFHSKYGSILHHLPNKAIYWSKIVIFSFLLAFRQTDRQTNILRRHSPRYAYASRGKNQHILISAFIWRPLCLTFVLQKHVTTSSTISWTRTVRLQKKIRHAYY